MTATIGVFGKHPDYGDFMSHRVDAPLVTWFQGWLDAVLPTLKSGLADRWDAAWDAAPMVRFWIGRGVAGRTVCGVLVASCDKVGRRYPMVVLASAAAIEAPVQDPDQAFYERIEAALQDGADTRDIKEIIADLPSSRSEGDDTQQETPSIWAHHPDGDLDALLRSAGAQDARRAITGRSYWWTAAREQPEPAVWLGQAGLPDAATLGWMMFGQTATLTGAQNA